MEQIPEKQSKGKFFTKEVNGFLVFAGAGLVISYIFYFWFPEYLPLIIEEDNLVENLSALGFLTAGILGIWAVKKNYKWKKLSMLVAFVGFLGFLDEISFGDRIIDFNYPSLMGWQIDSAHDLIAVAYLFLESIFGYHGTIVLAAVIVIAAPVLFFFQKKYTLKGLIGGIFETASGKYLVLFAFFLAAAVIVDLKENIPPRMIIEEMFEFYAAILLCLYSLSLPAEASAQAGLPKERRNRGGAEDAEGRGRSGKNGKNGRIRKSEREGERVSGR